MFKIISVSLCVLFGATSFGGDGKISTRQIAIREAVASLHRLMQSVSLDVTTPAFHDAERLERRRAVRVRIAGLMLKITDEVVQVSSADHKRIERQVNDAVALLKETVLDTTEYRETRDSAVELLAEEYYSIVGVEALLGKLKEKLDTRRNKSGEDRLVSQKLDLASKGEEKLRKAMDFFGGPEYRYSLYQ